MKNLFLLLFFMACVVAAQQPYYDDVNIQLTGASLYEELQEKLEIYNVEYTYGEFRDDTIVTDANPDDENEVLLIYGFNDGDGNCTTDRTRDNELFGGDNCEYNREHTFPRSLASPSMGSANNGTVGIAADPHNLRPSDVQRNGNRGSKKFAAGTGNSGDVGSGNWYPGDEWRGDVARAMMYMYVRYGDRCLPPLVGVGALQGDTEMLELFLQWNVDDPVSEVEEQRNNPLETSYGNRNPFIDNPFLATRIWGGPIAENKWDALSITDTAPQNITLYPNPMHDRFTISNLPEVEIIEIYSPLGQLVFKQSLAPFATVSTIDISHFKSGLYLLQIGSRTAKILKY